MRPADDAAPFAALAFKVVSDRFVGRLVYARVYSGTPRAGAPALNATTGRKERVGRLVRMHADRREDIEAVYAGNIAAFVRLKGASTGDTLCDPAAPIALESIGFPEPVVSVAIEPRGSDDGDRLGNALARLADEDLTFRVRSDPETGQTVIAGMGELHLEILVDRLRSEYNVLAPLAELFGYVGNLRSLTEGRAYSAMQLSHYDLAPSTVADRVIRKAAG